MFSDLHLEVGSFDRPLDVPDADVCVVAGDLCRGVATGVRYLSALLRGQMPCIYVAGNHEYWDSSIADEIEAGRNAASTSQGIHFLEDDLVTIDGVTFVGATLWTDFRIEGHRELAMAHAGEGMEDYRKICLRKSPRMAFSPHASACRHDRSREFIRSAMKAITGPSVIVSHHLPHASSVPRRFRGDLANAAYASDLGETIEEGGPRLWIHGHTHDSCDYSVGDTRIICNPRGYQCENKLFDRGLVVEIDA